MIRAIGRTSRRERRRRRGLSNGGGVLFLDQRAIAGSGGAGLLGWIPGVAKKRPPPQPKKRPPAALSRARGYEDWLTIFGAASRCKQSPAWGGLRRGAKLRAL